jgi:DNA-directed RNA polymerase specialized sigma24 family protein
MHRGGQVSDQMAATTIRAPLLRLRAGRLDDGRLAELAAAGDERAFEAIYDRHHRPLLGFCRHMLGSREEGEDALQQTFLRAHRSLVAQGAPDELRPWLFAIARNRCLTMLAARRTAAVPVEELEAATDGLSAGVEERADLRELLGDIARLPD